MNSKRIDTFTLANALQQIVNGTDIDEIIDDVLTNMTRRADAARLFPDGRARRRIENRLRHASASYARLCRQVFDLFKEAIEAEGLHVHPDFADDREIAHEPLERMLERVA
jgi:hypothetical protein